MNNGCTASTTCHLCTGALFCASGAGHYGTHVDGDHEWDVPLTFLRCPVERVAWTPTSRTAL